MDERRTDTMRTAIFGINNDKFEICVKQTNSTDRCSVGRMASVVARFFDVSPKEAESLAIGAISIVRKLEKFTACGIARLQNLSRTDTSRGTCSNSSCGARAQIFRTTERDEHWPTVVSEENFCGSVPTGWMRGNVKLQNQMPMPQALQTRVAARKSVERKKHLQNNEDVIHRRRNRRTRDLLRVKVCQLATANCYSWNVSYARMSQQYSFARALQQALRCRAACRKENETHKKII